MTFIRRWIEQNTVINVKKVSTYFILLVFLMTASYFNLFLSLENSFYDYLLIFKYLVSPDRVEDITIITIDNRSIDKLGKWPFSRQVYSLAIERLEEAGVRAVGLDIILSDNADDEGDEKLALTLERYDNVVLPVVVKLNLLRTLHGEERMILGVGQPLDKFTESSILGHINFLADSDGIIRRFPEDLDRYAPFSYQVAALTGADLQVVSGLINFIGPAGTIPHLSLIELLEGRYQPEMLENKLVLMGVDAAGLGDRYMTPFARYGYLSGLELHGQVLYSIINNTLVNQLPYYWNLLISLMMLIVLIYFFDRLRPIKSLIILVITIILYLITGVTIFYREKLLIGMAGPVISLILIYVFTLIKWYLVSEKEKRLLNENFSRYLSPQVIREIQKKPELLGLGGEEVLVTILFVDVRGFSQYVELKNSREVINTLNQLFSILNKIIFKYQGTLDKYLGDGMMAYFGAPVPRDKHQEQAFQAAVEMQQGNLPLPIGIGINTGPVIIGNIGSAARMEYTIIGDVVNKTARYVELAEPGEIICGQPTYLGLSNKYSSLGWVEEMRETRGSSRESMVYHLKIGQGGVENA